MFRVKHKDTGLSRIVYAVSGIRFLIWIDTPGDEHWEWVDMTEFEPMREGVR